MNGSIEYTLAGGALIGAGVPGYVLADLFKDRKNIIYVSPPVAAILTEVLPRTDLSSMSLANEDLRLFVNQLFSINEFLVAGEYIDPLDSRELIYPQALQLIQESVANHLKTQRDTQRLAELKKNNPNPNKSKKSRGGTRISE